MEKIISLKAFIPEFVLTDSSKAYPSIVLDKGNRFFVSYVTDGNNNSHKTYSDVLPAHISRTKETFEVLGLLQAEMGKTQNGCVVFANCEYKLVNKVLRWFAKEFDIPTKDWRWYLRINLVEPSDSEVVKKLTEDMKAYWIAHAHIDPSMAHPKTLCFVNETENKTPQNHGTIMIELKRNLFSQIIKKYVKEMSYSILDRTHEEIQAFMRGIIAGEGCVEINRRDKNYRIHITAIQPLEKKIYSDCLNMLGVGNHNYAGKDLIISRKENNLQLLKQQLMTLSPSKYARFLSMMQLYGGIRNETHYFRAKGVNRPANKTSPEKIDAVLTLSTEGKGSREIADHLGLGILVVQRLREKHGLGKRWEKSSSEVIEKIRALCERHPFFTAEEVSLILRVHEGRVWRVRKKYTIPLVKAGPKKVPQYILDEVTGERGFKKVLEMEALAHRKL